MSKLGSKTKLLFRMRRYARLAAFYRLTGRMTNAANWDNQIEIVYRAAKSQGFREDPFVLAEERGREEGQRRYDRSRGMRTSSPSGRDRRKYSRSR